jgi:hypothetical protein
MAGKTLKVDERAVQVIAAQYAKLRSLGASWGTWHEHYIAAKDSHAKVVESLFMSGFGDTCEVWRDDDLSLIVHEGSFTYGIVWFPHKRKCTVAGCTAYLREDGTAYHYGDRSTWAGCEPGEHTPDIPYDRATPGTWSTHS